MPGRRAEQRLPPHRGDPLVPTSAHSTRVPGLRTGSEQVESFKQRPMGEKSIRDRDRRPLLAQDDAGGRDRGLLEARV